MDRYIPHSDFFTIDVAETIGKPAAPEALSGFVRRHPELVGRLAIPGIEEPFQTTRPEVEGIAAKYLLAVQEAARIYRHIREQKGRGGFVTEVSMDETDSPQTPPELLVILAALADERVPLQTIAPKFTGRFNKGIDYVGDLAQVRARSSPEGYLAVIRFAVGRYGLPGTLKLSVHSGSDKFSIYGPIRRALGRFQAGVHLETAGTTWLEEVIGLAEAGSGGLALAKEMYTGALGISINSALPTRASSTSTPRACRRRPRCTGGPPSSLSPPCGMTRPTRATIPTSGSSCTWATRLPRSWGAVILTR